MPATALPSPSQIDWRALRCEWLWVYESVVPDSAIWSPEVLVPSGVFFVLRGLARIHVDGRRIEVPTGSAFFSAQGMRKQSFIPGTRLLSVGFRVSSSDGLPLFARELNNAIATSRLRHLNEATRRLYRAEHGTRKNVAYREATEEKPLDLAAWCAREAHFRTWFAAYARTLEEHGIAPQFGAPSRDTRLREIVRRLDAWPLTRTLQPAEICAGLRVGARRLEQLLAGQLGVTPHTYINRRRVASARQLLAHSATPLKLIAHDLGFRHASHFTKWFRRHSGASPSAFRAGGGDAAA